MRSSQKRTERMKQETHMAWGGDSRAWDGDGRTKSGPPETWDEPHGDKQSTESVCELQMDFAANVAAINMAFERKIGSRDLRSSYDIADRVERVFNEIFSLYGDDWKRQDQVRGVAFWCFGVNLFDNAKNRQSHVKFWVVLVTSTPWSLLGRFLWAFDCSRVHRVQSVVSFKRSHYKKIIISRVLIASTRATCSMRAEGTLHVYVVWSEGHERWKLLKQLNFQCRDVVSNVGKWR